MGLIISLWIGVLVIIGVLGAIIYTFLDDFKPSTASKVVAGILGLVIVISLVFGVIITGKLTDTESFKRFKKSWQSEFDGGITREITVYLENGDVIYNVEGKFDVEYGNERLKWVDENGDIQLIYLGRSATAVVNEKSEEVATKWR